MPDVPDDDLDLDPSVTIRWGLVKCGKCGAVYNCTPQNDHYLPAGAERGDPKVCFGCLLSMTREAIGPLPPKRHRI